MENSSDLWDNKVEQAQKPSTTGEEQEIKRLTMVVHQAQEIEKLKKRYFRTSSHLLRTPLTALHGYLEMLDHLGPVLEEDERQSYVKNSLRICEEMMLLLVSVLDAIELEGGDIVPNARYIALADTLHTVLAIVGFAQENVVRSIDVQVQQDLHVWIDEGRLQQVLYYLFDNIQKYTPAGTPVTIWTECLSIEEFSARFTNDVVTERLIDPASGTFVLLAVRDSGEGIVPAEQPGLFQKFVRLEPARKAFPDAPGLGLYLARRLLACMGGLIWLESSGCAGEGCTVYVAFPAYRKPRRTV